MAPAFPPVTPTDLGTVRVENESGVVAVGRLSLTTDHDGAIDFAARGTRGPEPGVYRLRIKRRQVEAELRELQHGDRGRMRVSLAETLPVRR